MSLRSPDVDLCVGERNRVVSRGQGLVTGRDIDAVQEYSSILTSEFDVPCLLSVVRKETPRK